MVIMASSPHVQEPFNLGAILFFSGNASEFLLADITISRAEDYSDRAGNGPSVLLSNHTGLASFSKSSDGKSIIWYIRVSPMRFLKLPDFIASRCRNLKSGLLR